MKKVNALFGAIVFAIIMSAMMSSCNDDTSGKVTFWYGQGVALYANSIGITSFTYYLNGEIIGTSASNAYSDSLTTINCGGGGAVTKSIELEGNDSAIMNYKIIDDVGHIWWEGAVKIENGSCLIKKLVI